MNQYLMPFSVYKLNQFAQKILAVLLLVVALTPAPIKADEILNNFRSTSMKRKAVVWPGLHLLGIQPGHMWNQPIPLGQNFHVPLIFDGQYNPCE